MPSSLRMADPKPIASDDSSSPGLSPDGTSVPSGSAKSSSDHSQEGRQDGGFSGVGGVGGIGGGEVRGEIRGGGARPIPHTPWQTTFDHTQGKGQGSVRSLPTPNPHQVVPDAIAVGCYKLLALDVDGTLIRQDKRLSTRNLHAVKAAIHHGVKVVLASARPPRSMRKIYSVLGLDTPLINYNGALIQQPGRRKPIHHQPLSLELAREVIDFARDLDSQVVVSIEILDKWYTDHVDETLPTETSMEFMPDFVGPLEAILQTPVTKLMLLAPPERLAPIHQAIAQEFSGRVALAVSDEHLLQVIHPEVDKGKAVARVAEMFGIAREHVMAIGDAPNDLGMLTWAGLGLAMGNAWPVVRQQARAVLADNDHDGVAAAIERYILV